MNAISANSPHAPRRKVPCPACGWRLIDACEPVETEIRDMRADVELPWMPDFVVRCNRCKKEYGIRKPAARTANNA